MAQDDHVQTNHYEYFVTISPQREFLREERETLCAWHSKFDSVLLVAEDRPSDGVEHYHSIIQSTVKATTSITKQLARLFEKEQWPYTKGVTVQVKKVSDRIGLFHYLTKDMGDKPPLGIKGWKMTWIKQQCVENVKKIPHKMLNRGGYTVNNKIGPNLVITYAKARSLPLTGKLSFSTILCEMAAAGYQFSGVKLKFLYAETMALTGSKQAFASLLENELHFLD